MNRITYILFLFFIYTFSFTPFWLLYFFSDVLYYFFFYVYRYRRNIVWTNLSRAFPDLSPEEIRKISKEFYRHFSDILVEGVKAFSMNRRQVVERYRLLNPEVLNTSFGKKQSVIAVLGHYNNWEWGSIAAGLQVKHKPVAFYKPLSNKLIDDYIEKTRAKSGTELISISHTTRSFDFYSSAPAMFIMVADQSPSNLSRSVWVKFLNQETATLHGPEKHAVRSNMPVYFADVQKVRRGFYTVNLQLLVEDPSQSYPGEITEKYMKALEDQIIRKPEFWLWSHRRWKHKR
jgi:KDO2-lipid IV(A) lauroyltransferase